MSEIFLFPGFCLHFEKNGEIPTLEIHITWTLTNSSNI